MNPERTGRRVKNRIKNQVILEMLVDRIAIEVRKNRGMDEYMRLIGNNVQDRWEKIFIKTYEKYPYLLDADGFKIEDIIYSVLDMFSRKDIEKFNSKQIEMVGDVFADTVVTFCNGYNKILELGQEEEEND